MCFGNLASRIILPAEINRRYIVRKKTVTVALEKLVTLEEIGVAGAGILPAHVRVVPCAVQLDLVPCVAFSRPGAVDHKAVQAQAAQHPLIGFRISVADDHAAVQKSGERMGLLVDAPTLALDGVILAPIIGGDTAEQILGGDGLFIVAQAFRGKGQQFSIPKGSDALAVCFVPVAAQPVGGVQAGQIRRGVTAEAQFKGAFRLLRERAACHARTCVDDAGEGVLALVGGITDVILLPERL